MPGEGLDFQSDPPQATSYDMGHTVTIGFTGHSGLYYTGGSATGTVTVDGVSVTKSASVQPGGGGYVNESGTYPINAPIALSGEQGEITRTYTASGSSNGWGFGLDHRRAPVGQAYIWIDTATYTPAGGGQLTVTMSGRWRRLAGDVLPRYQIKLAVRESGSSSYNALITSS